MNFAHEKFVGRIAIGHSSVIARSASDEAIHTCFAALWVASLRSQ
jgi:hypothetical protein